MRGEEEIAIIQNDNPYSLELQAEERKWIFYHFSVNHRPSICVLVKV